MKADMLKAALLTRADLADDFHEDEPTAAFGPKFISGDEAGRRVVELTNLLVEGSDPDNLATVHVMFGNPAGSFLFHNLGSYPTDRAKELFDDFTGAVANCNAYVMELNDKAQVAIERTDVRPVSLGDSAQRVTWITKVPGYTIDTAWVFARVDGVLILVNTRFPDASEVDRLAELSVRRLQEVGQTVS
jgi:predicted deacylase